MAKVTITIEDNLITGKVNIRFNPPIKEMHENPEKTTAAHCYAAAAANSFLKLTKQMKDDPEYRERNGLFIPASRRRG